MSGSYLEIQLHFERPVRELVEEDYTPTVGVNFRERSICICVSTPRSALEVVHSPTMCKCGVFACHRFGKSELR
eukprot:5719433-Pyramimonas_sp.AAC.1